MRERDEQLREINNKLDHQHDMLHSMARALAAIARNQNAGGLSPEQTAALVARLNTHADQLEGIAAPPEQPV